MSLQTQSEDVSPLLLRPPLEEDHARFWSEANKDVLWGWKRDVDEHSRVVYYSSELQQVPDGIAATDHYFFYKHRTKRSVAADIHDALTEAVNGLSNLGGEVSLDRYPAEPAGFDVVELEVGTPDAADEDKVTRLQQRTPRDSIDNPTRFPHADPKAVADVFPADLYAGSGVSYEAGLPTLREVHDKFDLDDYEAETFTHGEQDELPYELRDDPAEKFRDFCELHTLALTAFPTRAQKIIADFYDRDLISQVYSDNVDNMLCKVEVPFTRTRGSGVFNERFPADFETDTLLVVGVAADRRDIIEQARDEGMDVVVVNPRHEVSLGVQHLNYIEPEDDFFEMTADRFFTKADKNI